MSELELYCVNEYRRINNDDESIINLSDEEILKMNPPTSEDYYFFTRQSLERKKSEIESRIAEQLDELKSTNELITSRTTPSNEIPDLRHDAEAIEIKKLELANLLVKTKAAIEELDNKYNEERQAIL
jgi:hypothetical protein